MSSAKAKPRSNKRAPSKCSPEDFLKSLKAARELRENDSSVGIIAALESSGVSSPIVLIGTQHVRSRRTIDWLRENFFGKTEAGASSYFGQDFGSAASVRNISASLCSPSLFAEAQLVVLYDADKVKAAAAKPLAEAIERGLGCAILILVCESFKQTAPLFSRLPKNRMLVEFKDLSPAKLKRWIAKEVSLSGNQAGIEQNAAELLIRSFGSDVSSLSREIHKLSLLCNPSEKITSGLVRELSLRSPEVTSFELMQQIAKKNSAAAAALTSDLLQQGFHPLQLCSFLSRCIRTLLANHGRSAAREDDSGLSAELSNNWFLRNLRGADRLFVQSDLNQSLEILKGLDFKLKDAGLPNELALSIAVQRIASRNFPPARH